MIKAVILIWILAVNNSDPSGPPGVDFVQDHNKFASVESCGMYAEHFMADHAKDVPVGGGVGYLCVKAASADQTPL